MREMGNGQEAMSGWSAEEISPQQFRELAPKLHQDLDKNALDSSQTKSIESWHGERATFIHTFGANLNIHPERQRVFVAYGPKKEVVGFFAVQKAGGNTVQAQALWTKFSGERQHAIIDTLLTEAKAKLDQDGYRHVIIEAPEPSKQLLKLKHKYKGFLRMVANDNDAEAEEEPEEPEPQPKSDEQQPEDIQ